MSAPEGLRVLKQIRDRMEYQFDSLHGTLQYIAFTSSVILCLLTAIWITLLQQL